MTAYNALKEPFPIDVLPLLNFGKADGRLDDHLEDAFVLTRSTSKFFQDQHSIIVGPIGSGKSALFELVKTRSSVFPVYKDCLIVPIEESISFDKLGKLIEDLSPSVSRSQVFQLLWKFHITVCIAEKLASNQEFPVGGAEKELNKFLKIIKSKEYDPSILGKLMGLLKKAALTIKTKISSTPVTVEATIEGDFNDGRSQSEINIDRIINQCIKSAKDRGHKCILVLIDRIDRFVAGEEYETQRKYVEALLEVDDDLSVSYPQINRKIFLREDLFSRLNYEALGYDKVSDNTLRLEWTDNELIKFLANRIYVALKKEKLMSQSIVLLSTDLTDFHLEGIESFRTVKFIPLWLKKKLFDLERVNKERDASLSSYLDRAIITKVFPRIIHHKDSSGKVHDTCIFDFLLSHFKDGHNKVTPRNLLRFLKEVVDVVSEYYDENQDQEAHVLLVNGDYEWSLFKKKCVYKAYCKAKVEYLRAISKVENEWTKYFATFLGKRGNKKVFDYGWVRSITNLEEDQAVSFMAYLEHIGFLSIHEAHPDPKRRTYKLPIIYMPTA